MATGEHYLVIFVELLQKLEIYGCIIIMFIYTKILVGITYEEMREIIFLGI